MFKTLSVYKKSNFNAIGKLWSYAVLFEAWLAKIQRSEAWIRYN